MTSFRDDPVLGKMALYDSLPVAVREVANKNFTLLKSDPKHPSLHFKRSGKVWSGMIRQ
jgi:hypothetical protein